MADLFQQLAQWQHTARFRFPLLIKPRAEDSHKGTFGTVAVVGGAAGMAGSGVLAASAALKGGAESMARFCAKQPADTVSA